MAIFGTDDRILVADEDVTTPPYNSVVAVDSRDENLPDVPNIGSGIAIGTNHVLTAAHVVSNDLNFNNIVVQEGGRILLPEQLQPGNGSSFPPRSDTSISPIDDNVKFADPEDLLPSPKTALENDNDDPENNIIALSNDIALLNLTSDAPDLADRAMGIITFTNEFDLSGIDIPASERIQVSTAGYPGAVEIDELSVSKNEPFITFQNGVPIPVGSNALRTDATQMFADEGTITLAFDGELNLAEFDAEQGQSGSGIWTILEGDSDPRVLGVLSRERSEGFTSDRVDATLITPGIYYGIIERMEEDDQGIVDGNELPENAIVGTDSFNNRVDANGRDTIEGTYRRERILGKGDDDVLKGKGGDDRLEGGEGDDQLTGGAGDDKLDGGTNPSTLNPFDNEQENDVAIFSGKRIEYDIDTETTGDIFGLGGTTTTNITHLNGGIDGTDILTNIEFIQFADSRISLPFDEENDPDGQVNFTGGSGNDNLIGNILNNLLLGNGGSDRLEGKQGKDTLKGNDGNDSLSGGDGNDLLQGGKNKDQLNGNGGSDRVFGDLGNDLLKGEGEDDYLGSGDGNDTVKGGTGNDSIAGGNGNDTLQGGDGNDNLNGNGGSDRVFGDLGNDLMQGGTGNDYLSGNNGNDTLKGQSGIDSLAGGNGLDLLQGGDGNDNLNGNGGSDRVFGDLGNDLLEGGTGNDYLSGGNGFDTLTGGFGRDTLAGGCLLYTSPSPRDGLLSRMPSSA